MTRHKTASTDRLIDVAKFFDALPEGKSVGQQEIMTALNLQAGSWRGLRKILDTYIVIQNSSKIERHFKQFGKQTITKYKVRKHETQTEEVKATEAIEAKPITAEPVA